MSGADEALDEFNARLKLGEKALREAGLPCEAKAAIFDREVLPRFQVDVADAGVAATLLSALEIAPFILVVC